MTRWKLVIEYDGGPFVGWQRQSNGESEFTIWVSDTASRTGSHSLRMGASSLETSAHYTTMQYRLSQVDYNWNKDRITPGTIITVNGYMMTPEDSKIEGNNTGSVVLAAVDDTWNYSTSPVVNADKDGIPVSVTLAGANGTGTIQLHMTYVID